MKIFHAILDKKTERSVRRISGSAKIARSTFYRHFSSVAAVPKECETRIFEAFDKQLATINESRKNNIENLVHDTLVFLNKEDKTIHFLYCYECRDTVIRIFVKVIEILAERDQVSRNIIPELMAGAIYGLLGEWLKDGLPRGSLGFYQDIIVSFIQNNGSNCEELCKKIEQYVIMKKKGC